MYRITKLAALAEYTHVYKDHNLEDIVVNKKDRLFMFTINVFIIFLCRVALFNLTIAKIIVHHNIVPISFLSV